MATWNPQQVSSRTATVPTYQRRGAGGNNGQHVLNNGANAMLIVRNGHASNEFVVTFITQVTVDGQAVGNKSIQVNAGETRIIGPFPPDIYYNEDNEVRFTISRDGQNFTIAAIAV